MPKPLVKLILPTSVVDVADVTEANVRRFAGHHGKTLPGDIRIETRLVDDTFIIRVFDDPGQASK